MPVTGAKRSEKYEDREDFTKKFIDARLFGGVSAPANPGKNKKKVFNLTGPVQFGMGQSLHPVKKNFIKGTGAFATSEDAIQRTFREEFNITYGLIAFHGVINEVAAKKTGLTQSDVDELIDALWNGTKSLLSRSKKGHMPRLLLKIDYKEPQFFIGDLAEALEIKYIDGKDADTLTDVSDYELDVSALNDLLEKYQDKIAKVELLKDDRLSLTAPIKLA